MQLEFFADSFAPMLLARWLVSASTVADYLAKPNGKIGSLSLMPFTVLQGIDFDQPKEDKRLII